MTTRIVEFWHLISGTVRGLFRHDSTTGAASVQFWVVAATVLLLAKFAVGTVGPWLSSQRFFHPAVNLLRILNHYAVSYTLGLMVPSSSEQGAAVNTFFQVWAVLIVIMQDSIRIGRPYQPKGMSLVDLLASLWSANQLWEQKALYLQVPLWLMWSIHASRIIWCYLTTDGAVRDSASKMKFVSDYMSTSGHTDADASPETMKGYRFIIAGEEKLKMNVVGEPPSKLELQQKEELITVEDVWDFNDDRLLGKDADGDNRFKDVCLSFALYKLLRRRFFDFPIHEANHQGTAKLVTDAILDKKNDYERAFRVTDVELSVLHDFIYSKHSVVFADGFPYARLLLSLLMTGAASYLAYAVRSMPSSSTAPTDDGRVARITHGVFVTHCIIAVVISRELWEVGIYVLSQWTNTLIICHYIKLQRHGQRCSWFWGPQRWITAMVARLMFPLVRFIRGHGSQNRKIQQYNLLMSARANAVKRLNGSRRIILRKKKLESKVKKVLFGQLKDLITEAAKPGNNPGWSKDELLHSYLKNAFADVQIKDIHSELSREGETHKILAWHVATSLCQIKLLEKSGGGQDNLYDLILPDSSPSGNSSGGDTLPNPLSSSNNSGRVRDGGTQPSSSINSGGGNGDNLTASYTVAVTLSNYCAYLVTQALVPDNGLVANKVFDAVHDEACDALRWYGHTSSIISIGARLADKLASVYKDKDEELWERLGKFWAGFLLHLSASTRAAKHQVHLQGNGELTTRLWALLSHAGFLGKASHGHQMLDPDDLHDAS